MVTILFYLNMLKNNKTHYNNCQYGYCRIHGKQAGYPGRTDCHVKDNNKNGVVCGIRLTKNK
jgi:hypothetical protein